MLKKSMLSALALAGLACGLAPVAAAQSYGVDCRTQQQNRQVTGALVGGLLGAAAGGLLANEINDDDDDDDDHRYHDDRRSRYHGWGDRDDRRYNRHDRYRGFDRYEHHDRGDDDDDGELLGVLLGAAIGGFAGSEIGKTSVNCRNTAPLYGSGPTHLTGGAPVWSDPYASGGAYSSAGLQGGPVTRANQGCELVWRETQFPDGQVIREQVRACPTANGWRYD